MENIKIKTSDKLWTKHFAVIMLTHFLIYTAIYILMSTLPLFMQHIGGNKFMAGFISAIFTFTGFFTRPWFGRLADSRGRKVIMIIGILIILSSTVSYMAVSSILWLLIFRVIQGIGWSASSTATSTIASDIIPSSRRYEGMGYFGMSASVAMAVGPALGLKIISGNSYTMMFIVTSIFVILGLVLGTLVKSTEKEVLKDNNIVKKATLFERSAIAPSLVFLLVSMTYSGIATFLPSYGISKNITNVGVFFTIYAATLFLTRPITGKLADKIGTSKVVLPGIIFLMTALFLLVKAHSIHAFLAASVFYGIGFGSIQPILNALVVSLAPNDKRGAANATFLAAMDLGMGIGSLGWGIISQKFGYVYIYSCSIFLAFLAAVLYLIISSKSILPDKNEGILDSEAV